MNRPSTFRPHDCWNDARNHHPKNEHNHLQKAGMRSRAREGTCLEALVGMAIPVCQRAELECPRTGPGRPPEIPDWVIAVLILVVVAKRRKSKSAQYRFLQAHQRELAGWLGTTRFPSRTTYFDRYKRAFVLFQQAARIQTRQEAQAGHIALECVAVDKSLIPTCGTKWSQRERQARRLPVRADAESAWTYSPHHGWVLGYGYEVVATAQKRGIVWPVLASVEPANVSEKRTFADKIDKLPAQTRYVLADKGYASEDLAAVTDRRRRRRFRRERRQVRRVYMQSPQARRLFSRRSRTVEPFNEWFKSLFELHEGVWHRGLANNRTQILAALFVYQLLIRFNRRKHRANAKIRWILDSL